MNFDRPNYTRTYVIFQIKRITIKPMGTPFLISIEPRKLFILYGFNYIHESFLVKDNDEMLEDKQFSSHFDDTIILY